MFVDYYAILEISQSATLEEIKAAYRKQAKQWHPDKNPGFDTTGKMKDINEAKLILTDLEARLRYDREYLNFVARNRERRNTKKTETEGQKTQENHRSNSENDFFNGKQNQRTEQSREEEWTYQFNDEILQRWMENARKQAMRNVHDMVIEFRDSSIAGFGVFFKTAFMAIVMGLMYFIILLILKSL